MTDTPRATTPTPGPETPAQQPPALEVEAVTRFLQAHPDFFAEHDELLLSVCLTSVAIRCRWWSGR
jgi:hypothetical protein